jgi:hypothetical protein
MVEASNVTDRHHPTSWQFTLRGLFLLTLSVAIGLSYWKVGGDWYGGTLAAIAFWIVLGLAAQVCDVWIAWRRSEALTAEERWGHVFAIFWRLALCVLMAVGCVLPPLITSHVVVPNDGEDVEMVSSMDIWNAVLPISLIVAVASSPMLMRPGPRRPWSWVVALFGGAAGFVLFTLLLHDRLCITFLVHVTIAGIMAAAPLWCAEDAVTTYSHQRAVQFFDVTTAGVLAILASCALLWLFALRWREGGRRRAGLGILLAASLAVMLALTLRIALVEVPGVTPILAANINVPTAWRLVPSVLLVLLLTTVVAARWSKLSAFGPATTAATWRRDDGCYYHERLIIPLFLGGAGLAMGITDVCGIAAAMSFFSNPPGWLAVGYVMMMPSGSLWVAMLLLAVQAVLSAWRNRREPFVAEPLRLSPGLFLLLWVALLAVIVCSAPIFAAWGLALWLR